MVDTTVHVGDSKTNNKIDSNWSFAGQTRHDDGRQNFFRLHKEEGILIFRWVSDDENERVSVRRLSKDIARAQS